MKRGVYCVVRVWQNLMMVGRNISVSHVALGATRLMLTHAIMGQAAGTAAWLCRQHDTTPRGVYQEHLAELQQQLLKDGCYLVDLPNSDPRDLARTASVSASSSMIDEEREEIMGPERIIDGFARAEHGVMHSWRPGLGQLLPQWVELDFGKPVSFNCVHVSFQTRARAADAFQIEVWEGNRWQTAVEVTANKQRRRVICFDRRRSSKLRLTLTQAPTDVAVCEIRAYDEPAGGLRLVMLGFSRRNCEGQPYAGRQTHHFERNICYTEKSQRTQRADPLCISVSSPCSLCPACR